jgi:hypothetical protein
MVVPALSVAIPMHAVVRLVTQGRLAPPRRALVLLAQMVVPAQSMVAPTHAHVLLVLPPRVPVLLVPTVVPVR